jgi:RNA polymerase sigma factor (sigma-70 family)
MTTTMPRAEAHTPPFQPFYVAHRAGVLRLLVGMVGPDDAQDCFQETWLNVLRAWPPADLDGRLDSWVLTIAHRCALDLLRGRAAELPTEHVPELSIDDERLADCEPDELWDAVRALAPKQRGALVLRIVLDLSHAQVGDVLGCSEAAARRSYADAIAALRRPATPTKDEG